MTPPLPTSRQCALMFTDIFESLEMKLRHGADGFADLIARHDRLFGEMVQNIGGGQILRDTGDGFLTRFGDPTAATLAALRFQRQLEDASWNRGRLRVRIGIHTGEVFELGASLTGTTKVVGMTADLASRLTALAGPGQVFCSRAAFEHAHTRIEARAANHNGTGGPFRWVTHGNYHFKGSGETMEIFQVGPETSTAFDAPADHPKAHRVMPEV